MARTHFRWVWMLAWAIPVSFAHAGTNKVSGQANQQAKLVAKSGETEATSRADASARAEARGATAQELQAIRQRGAAAKAKARAAAEAKFEAAAREVEKEVAKHGEIDVSARLASEFGIAASALSAQKEGLMVSWGEILIAHTLQANAASAVSVRQMCELREAGLGWGQIAAGLGFELDHAVSAVKSEARVAVGRTSADGKVAVIRGSKLDVGSRANANAAANTNSAAAGVRAGAGVGASITPSLPAVKP